MSKNRAKQFKPIEGHIEQDDKLLLEDIFNTADPTVQKFFFKTLREEVATAEERALLRVGVRFRHLLPPKQQLMLDRTVGSVFPKCAALAM